MSTRRSIGLPGLVTAALLLLQLAHLASPAVVPSDRDLTLFHLPLRTALAEAASEGVPPLWNRHLNGGQPILSNPNYAAFYPPTWLLLVSVPYSLNLLILGHAIWALLGSWRLLRHLGARRVAATMGALSFGLAPWFLGLSGTLNFYCGMSWWPWAILAGVRAFTLPLAHERRHHAFLAAGILALQLFAGEPVVPLLTGLGLALVALAAPLRPALRARTLASIGLLALLLGSLQLLPTGFRLLESPRAGQVDHAELTRWSLAPARLPEVLLPHLWGDPMRDEEGLYFGWRIHDRAFPYVLSLYAGVLIGLLGLEGLLLGAIPFATAWRAMALLSLALSLGRHLPGLGPRYDHVPLLNLVRYPEKFIVLGLAALVIAGALNLERRLASSPTSAHLRPGRSARFAEWVAAVLATGTVGLFVLGFVMPQFFESYILAFGSTSGTEKQLGFLFTSLATTGLLLALVCLLLRRTRIPWVQPCLLLFVVLDLGLHGWRILPSLPHREVLRSADTQPVEGASRLATVVDLLPEGPHLAIGTPGQQQILGRFRQFEPYSANLWGSDYVLNQDFDRMATPWAALARRQFESLPVLSAEQLRLAEAWSAHLLVEPKQPAAIVADFQARGDQATETRLRRLPNPLPEVRLVPRVSFFSELDGALAWLRSVGFDLAAGDSCLVTDPPTTATKHYASGTVLDTRYDSTSITVEYRAQGPGFLVIASTFDRNWNASIDFGKDGESDQTSLCPTAIGQIGVEVPGGHHTLRLRYRDPWIPVGAAISLLSLLGAVLLDRTTAYNRAQCQPSSSSPATSPPSG